MKEHTLVKPQGANGVRVTPPRRPTRERISESGGRAAAVAAWPPQRLALRGPLKTARANLKKDYGLTIEVGFVLALLILVGLFHMEIQFNEEFDTTAVQQEVVQMEEIVQTEQIQKPPPPPKPQLPVVVADDVILDDVELNLDAALDIGTPLEDLPPPPPAPEEPAEEAEEAEEEIFVVVEQMPELIGGIAALQKEIRYPEMARQAGVNGRVFVQFIVDEMGNVSNPVVLRGIGGGCDEEALRVIKKAKFKPGMQRGKAVKVRYVIPIVFKLR